MRGQLPREGGRPGLCGVALAVAGCVMPQGAPTLANGEPLDMVATGSARSALAAGCSATGRDDDLDGVDDGEEDCLLQRHAPVVYLYYGYRPSAPATLTEDPSKPANVDWFLARARLRMTHKNCRDCQFLDYGVPNQTNILQQRHKRRIWKLFKGCRHTNPIIYSNAGPYIKNDAFFLQLPDSAHTGSSNPADWRVYGHVYKNTIGGVNLQYWFFYAYNDAPNCVLNLNHEGDWEHITIRLDANYAPQGAWYARHGGSNWRDWPNMNKFDANHPYVYSMYGSHASHHDTSSMGMWPCQEAAASDDNHRWFTWAGGKGASAGYQGGGVVNVGERDNPLNGQTFIQFVGRWGEIGVFGGTGVGDHSSGPVTPPMNDRWNRDRKMAPVCGDKKCEAGEDCNNCTADCGACGSTCSGTVGQWAGCRGNGCAVCSELVAAYPSYFANHPSCTANTTCGGLYYTCNSSCPAPTDADQASVGSSTTCNGTAGEWSGCRGNGCAVCSELVADYPRYFQNHPGCSKNDSCGGLYYTCNSSCPAPTDNDQYGVRCGEATCKPAGAAYISHFEGSACTGREYYYTPYFSGTFNPNPDGIYRPWNGQGNVGDALRTVAVKSWKGTDGVCHDDWPGGNSLNNLVRVYRYPYCGDGVCTLEFENCGSCEVDCPSDHATCLRCGNGTCESNENCMNCAADCGTCPTTCGNGVCDEAGGENCENCAADCGQCATCGDYHCNPVLPSGAVDETCTSCPQDCGGCNPTCGEASCVAVKESFSSHFSGPRCTGSEYSYTNYFGADGVMRSSTGSGLAGSALKTVTVKSYMDGDRQCYDAWPSGTPIGNMVSIYRAQYCGDGVCSGTESSSSCAADCTAWCGDGQCNSGETCSSCATDCGACPPRCGDGLCNGTETCSTCSTDCGECPPSCLKSPCPL